MQRGQRGEISTDVKEKRDKERLEKIEKGKSGSRSKASAQVQAPCFSPFFLAHISTCVEACEDLWNTEEVSTFCYHM